MAPFLGYMYLGVAVLTLIVGLVYWATHPKDQNSFN